MRARSKWGAYLGALALVALGAVMLTMDERAENASEGVAPPESSFEGMDVGPSQTECLDEIFALAGDDARENEGLRTLAAFLNESPVHHRALRDFYVKSMREAKDYDLAQAFYMTRALVGLAQHPDVAILQVLRIPRQGKDNPWRGDKGDHHAFSPGDKLDMIKGHALDALAKALGQGGADPNIAPELRLELQRLVREEKDLLVVREALKALKDIYGATPEELAPMVKDRAPEEGPYIQDLVKS